MPVRSEATTPERREILLEKGNFGSPELLLEQPKIPTIKVEPFVPYATTTNEFNLDSPEVISYLWNSVANETWGDLARAQPALYANLVGDPNEDLIIQGVVQGKKHAPTEKLRTTEEQIQLGFSRLIAGIRNASPEEREDLLKRIKQQMFKDRSKN